MDKREDFKREEFLPQPVTATSSSHQYPLQTLVAVISFYWVASLSLVFLNKYILSTSEYKFPYPLFVTWFQFLVALVVLYAWGKIGQT